LSRNIRGVKKSAPTKGTDGMKAVTRDPMRQSRDRWELKVPPYAMQCSEDDRDGWQDKKEE